MSAFLEHPIAYAVPERLTAHSAWKSHVPFGMALAALLRPRSVVELGTQGGDSYCAFCQGLAAAEVDSSAMAVDTWEGDAQSGFYGPEVLADLRAHHDPRYGSFSRLVQTRFEDARTAVPDGSVDLLHIDGQHGFDAVTEDWETWRSALSDRGVLLLHDTEEHQAGFGVHRLFRTLSVEHPSFAFFHGHGLGVVGIGTELDGPVRALLEADEAQARRVRLFFQRMGELTEARFEAHNHAVATQGAESRAERLEAERDADRAALEGTQRQLDEERQAHAAIRAEQDGASRALAAMETQLEARTAEVERTAAVLSRIEAERAALETDLERARDELEAAREGLNRAKAEAATAAEGRDEAREEARQAAATAARHAERSALAEAGVEAAREVARTAVERADDARAQAESTREEAEARVRAVQKQLEAGQRESEGLRVERDALRAERNEWTAAMRRMRGLEHELALLREDQVRIEHSVGFRAVTLQRRVVDRLLPHGTKRRRPYLRATTAIGRWLSRPAPPEASPTSSPTAESSAAAKPAPRRRTSPLIELVFSPIEVPISVVIPTKNGEDEGLERGLRGFRQQEGLRHPIELVVVDSASTDRTQAIARDAGATVHAIEPSSFNHGATRNLGASLAKGGLLLFSVQDAVPGHPTMVQELADLLLSNELAVVSAKQLTRADADPYCAFTLFNHYRALGDQTRMTAPGSQDALAAARGEQRWQLAYVDDVCALHQRRVFDRLQYRPMPYGEDLEYGIRCVAAGHGLGFYAEGGVVHSHLRSAAYQLRTHYVVRRDLGPLLNPGRPAPKPPLGALVTAGRRAFGALDAIEMQGDEGPPNTAVRACAQHLLAAGERTSRSSGDAELDRLLDALHDVASAPADLTLFDAMSGALERLALPFLETAYPTLTRAGTEDFVRKSLAATLGAALGDWAARCPETTEADRLREVLA